MERYFAAAIAFVRMIERISRASLPGVAAWLLTNARYRTESLQIYV
jgi:hypothetical protein